MFKSWKIIIPVLVVGCGVLSITFFVINRKRKNKLVESPVHQKPEPVELKPKVKKVIVLGLDGSGKSEFMSNLSNPNKLARENVEPTQGFNVVCQNIDSMSINYWEIGGQEKLRKYWPNFFTGSHLVLFIIDSQNKDRFPEAATEFKTLTTDYRLSNIPFIVLINLKNKNAPPSDDTVKKLGIDNILREPSPVVVPCEASSFESVSQVQVQIKKMLDDAE